MTMEFAMGRTAQASVTGMYKKLQKQGSKWKIHGYFALAGNIALMCFYTVVTSAKLKKALEIQGKEQ